MPISIAQAQKKNLSGLGKFGEDKGDEVELSETEAMFAEYGKKFMLNLGKYANAKNVVDTGKLLSEATFRIVDGNKLQLIMPDYFDYPNEGVKGVRSSKNAPASPYQFKTFGMSADGRRNIKEYIQRGHAKIATVRKTKDKALGIGREKKHLELIDIETNTLIYLIKAYGIKTTNYFNLALAETFKDFQVDMSEALGRDIIFSLEKLNRNGNNN